GNIIGTSMYKRGAPCSACEDGTSCDSASGLCHKPGESDGIGESDSGGGNSILWTILAVGLLGLLAATAAGIAFFYMRSRTAAEAEPE
ncbi:hypothetical protein MTO96_046701, partial [Rhipicephalus appendiculatus]